MEDGQIFIKTVIFENGVPCVIGISTISAFQDSHLGLKEIIDSMPKRNPGKQAGVEVAVRIIIRIYIKNGMIESII